MQRLTEAPSGTENLLHQFCYQNFPQGPTIRALAYSQWSATGHSRHFGDTGRHISAAKSRSAKFVSLGCLSLRSVFASWMNVLLRLVFAVEITPNNLLTTLTVLVSITRSLYSYAKHRTADDM